jgi:hypothetical protein
MMADVYKDNWIASTSGLPEQITIQLCLTKAEYVEDGNTCILCHDLHRPCEWDVHLPGDGIRIVVGLHEHCRQTLERRTAIDIMINQAAHNDHDDA